MVTRGVPGFFRPACPVRSMGGGLKSWGHAFRGEAQGGNESGVGDGTRTIERSFLS